MKFAADRTHLNQLMPLIACLLLFIGIGRIFSLVMHNPVLGYANNYDMIRLQACHQIWPADKIVDITTGTPAAPLRRYTLDKHVDTPCFPSSELLFTTIGIELGKLKNLVSNEVLISIKTIGLVKAFFLSITAILASLYFYRRQLHGAMLTNGLVMLLVLSDPGVTLYLNTFYKQFSAIYFLYLALIGVVVFAQCCYRPAASWLLLIGLLGLGFSKPQYIPLTLTFALLLSAYVVSQKQWKTVPVILLCAALPLILQASGYFTPRNDSMIRASHVNFVGSILTVAATPDNVLADLGLPKDCQALAGKTGYDPVLQKAHSCPEVDNLSNATAAYTLLRNPKLLIRMATRALEQQSWLQDSLGQVEGKRNVLASLYQRTLGSWLPALPNSIYRWLPLVTVLLPVLLLIRQSAHQSGLLVFMLLLGVLQLALMFFALLNDGLVEIGQNLFLLAPLVISEILCVPWLSRLKSDTAKPAN
jgi:hypothetical protein